MKADLSVYGLIGFQDFYRERQGIKNKNLLKLIAEHCFKNDIGLITICSHTMEQPRGVHNRFGMLLKDSKKLPSQYKISVLDKQKKVALIVEKSKKRVIIINAQYVVTGKNAHKDRHKKSGRIDVLIIGKNNIKTKNPINGTIRKNKTRSTIVIGRLAYPMFSGLDKNTSYIKNCDAVIAHSANIPFTADDSPNFEEGIYERGINERAKKIAKRQKVVWIAASNAHRIKDIGNAHISFDDNLINLSNHQKLVSSLKEVLVKRKFKNNCGYDNVKEWRSWHDIYYEAMGVVLGNPKETKKLKL
ncbi:MAG: PHP-associated domain-containing protein [Nanoarchaeota archaeon]|nr:PHP-associated domain-containing protein [Nanoarchaeota archaeon]